MSLPKITPCSCGHQPEPRETFTNINGYFRRRYYVYCPHCGAETPNMETRTKAIKAWNYGQENKENAAPSAATPESGKE